MVMRDSGDSKARSPASPFRFGNHDPRQCDRLAGTAGGIATNKCFVGVLGVVRTPFRIAIPLGNNFSHCCATLAMILNDMEGMPGNAAD